MRETFRKLKQAVKVVWFEQSQIVAGDVVFVWRSERFEQFLTLGQFNFFLIGL